MMDLALRRRFFAAELEAVCRLRSPALVDAFAAVYSAKGVRDEATNERLGQALMGGPAQWQTVARLRRDAHDASSSCWLHGSTWCFSAA